MTAVKLIYKPLTRFGLALLLGAVAATGPAQADAVSDFFSRKTVTLIAGFPPGGGYDTYIRVLARHFGRFIPGNPSIVPANLPGAGSMNLANRIYKSDPNDGTVMGEFASSVVMEPLLGNKAALFDPAKFSWIGSMSQDVAYCGVLQTPGAAATFDEMFKEGNDFRRRCAGGDHLSAPDDSQERARRAYPRHSRLCRYARHRSRHAARRGER